MTTEAKCVDVTRPEQPGRTAPMADTPTDPIPGGNRYRIRGEGAVVQIVTSRFLEGVTLDEGWVWLRRVDAEGAVLQAAHGDWLVPVLTDHDMRTISGGVTLRHGVVKDWVEQDQRWDIPVVEISGRGVLLSLRRADIVEIRHVLGKMLAEMPPDPLMPDSGTGGN